MLHVVDNPTLRACLVCAVLALDPGPGKARPRSCGPQQRVALGCKERVQSEQRIIESAEGDKKGFQKLCLEQ